MPPRTCTVFGRRGAVQHKAKVLGGTRGRIRSHGKGSAIQVDVHTVVPSSQITPIAGVFSLPDFHLCKEPKRAPVA
eukprot:1186501-Prorocentrum_minimum.AAC.4